MKSVSALTPRDVIHCSERWKFVRVCELMIEARFYRVPRPADWDVYGTETCILPDGSIGQLGYFISKGYRIIDGGSYLEDQAGKEERITVEIGFSSRNAVPSFFEQLFSPLVNYLKR